MNGNTAKTYMTWERSGEPYKENGRYYINVIHPLTKRIKAVRWYTNTIIEEIPKEKKHLEKLFGFEDENDSIYLIRLKNLTTEQRLILDTPDNDWRYVNAFGGAWINTKNAKLPIETNKIEVINWPQFKEEALKYLTSIKVSTSCQWWED